MSRDEQARARARELVMAAYAEAGMQPQPWFLHDDPASFRGSDYFLFKAIIEALRGASGGGMEYKLPCDVHLPPATVIKAGVSLETLKLAMELEGRPRHFHGNARASLPAPDHPAENAKSSGEVLAGSVAELLEMLSVANQEDGSAIFDHTPDEIGLHVMENHKEILAALETIGKERG
ncbi:hypothetical protein GG804_11260 [Sphingomonas histidinilytica]|uniref:hypothetical protein n=1 Tax=Rhizorhabdus histidinilytica TaxID=439228 RepID=UPI001ADC028E|nr:hypothetical protein [Rhizorhabdus histidinilytica]MBO9377345.1 hypothetical protein [Rhizorhabdus histidinilytica]